jgi:hypothetical protein
MSRFKNIAKMLGITAEKAEQLSPEVINILEKIKTDEMAVALKDSERAKYLDALDQTYGNAEKRAWDTQSIDLPELKKAFIKNDETLKDFEVSTGNNSDYTFNDDGDIIDETVKGITAEAKHRKTGKPAGNVPTLDQGNYYTVDDIDSNNPDGLVRVPKEFQRKGVASAMYNQIEKETGLPMQASNNQTPEGKKLWDSLNRYNYDLSAKRMIDERNELAKLPSTPETQEKIEKLNEYLEGNLKDKTEFNAKYRPFGNPRHPDAAFDPRFKNSPLLLAGTAAIPTTDINPLEAFKGVQENILEPVMSKYNKLKSYVTDPLSKQLDLTKDKSASKDLKTALDMGLDPVNLIPGAPGIGAGLLQMLGEKDEEE